MASKWDEMRSAFQEAKAQINSADAIVDDMARMLDGRMRKVNVVTLVRLKKELSKFNMKTARWSN